ncbi:hypothetical protein DP20_3266 [Shigella flexneri]|nr:hypothetical protein DP20_3266 [Shigella flexneri]
MNLAKSFLYAFVIQQMMLRKNHNVLDFSHHMHINAAIVIFTCRCQALPIFNSCQHYGVRRDRTFDAVHSQRPTQS